MMYDPNKNVREACNGAFAAIVRSDKIDSYLEEVFPVWFCSVFDSEQSIARLSRQLLTEAFSGDEAYFKRYYEEFLHFASEKLRLPEESVEFSSQVVVVKADPNNENAKE